MNARIPAILLPLVLLVCGSSLHAQCNPDAEGSCLEPHEGAGCLTTECCDVVCEVDGFCCSNSWDEQCVETATDLCDGLACPGFQPCGELYPEPGCDDQTCCRLVCDHDWFCCYIEWDQQCVAIQDAICGVAPCELTVPPGTPEEGEPCYQRLNDGCNLLERSFAELGCGDSVLGTTTTDGPRDTDWYRIDLVVPTTVTWRVRSEFPAQLVVVSGPCEGPMTAVRLEEDANCGETTIEQFLEPGTHALIVSAGLVNNSIRGGITCDQEDPRNPPDPEDPPVEPSFFGLRYLVDVTCVSSGLPGDLNGDGRVNGEDLLEVLAWWGTANALGDLDQSGLVDGADVLIILGAWTG